MFPGAFCFVSKDAQYISQVPDACKEEEEHADALCTLTSIVQEELRDARAEIENSAEIPEDLTPKVEVNNILSSTTMVLWLFR